MSPYFKVWLVLGSEIYTYLAYSLLSTVNYLHENRLIPIWDCPRSIQRTSYACLSGQPALLRWIDEVLIIHIHALGKKEFPTLELESTGRPLKKEWIFLKQRPRALISGFREPRPDNHRG
jgi:hypothetical protein